MIKGIISKYNPSTLSGALDIIIIEHPDGTLRSSPWHIRFGKLGLLHHNGKVVTVDINEIHAPFLMQIDESGRAQFFSSQSTNRSLNSSIIYPKSPAIGVTQVNIHPKDVRHILSKLKEQKQTNSNAITNNNIADFSNTKTINDENSKWKMIQSDSTVDLEAALLYSDQDPLPISTVSSYLDLAQSTKTISQQNRNLDNSNITDITNAKYRPVPSALLLSSIRYLLHYGKNNTAFTVSSLIQGPKTIEANIFLWKSNVKLIVSDVDGTVTSSDLLGHVLPTFGKDWTHPGLAMLYNKIEKLNEDIQFVYLSSRPIGEASLTRKMLKNIQQDGCLMPEGPLITAPDLAIPAMAREMQRKPHEFKIPTLIQIKNLFIRPNSATKSESNENLHLTSTFSTPAFTGHQDSSIVNDLDSTPDFNSANEIDNKNDNNKNDNDDVHASENEDDVMPFIFGFGNRKTDVISYNNIGLRDDQILLFDTKHRVLSAKQEILYKSIESLSDHIHEFNICGLPHIHSD